MNHQRDLGHAATTSGTTDLDSKIAPGRSSRNDHLVGPGGPRPSGLLMRKVDRGGNDLGEGAEHAVGAASTASGMTLPEDLRTRFEASLGADLSSVRIHVGASSHDAAAAVGAKAYTLGNDIHFAAGHYDPTSSEGQELIAHEVAHTVQQRGGTPHRQHKLEVSSPGDSCEHEADAAASAMVSGAAATVAGSTGLARKVMRTADEGDGPIHDGPDKTSGQFQEVPRWYQLPSTAVETNGAQATIYFATDDAFIDPNDLGAIKSFIAQHGAMLQSGEYAIETRGFADIRPGPGGDYNFNLAQLRASAVLDAIGKQLPGGKPDGSVAVSEGEVPSSNRPEVLARNRRVEVRIVKKEQQEFPLPPSIDPPPPPDPGYQPPADWYKDWELYVDADGGFGEEGQVEAARLRIRNPNNGDEVGLVYGGVGVAESTNAASGSILGGPYPFTTSAPCSIQMFASGGAAHVAIGASGGKWQYVVAATLLKAAGIDLPSGISGEFWILMGPQTAGADAVFVNTSGTSLATPNFGFSGSYGFVK